MDLTGKIAIVTGGAKGYGYGITTQLSKRGVKVWMTGRDKETLDRVAEELGAKAIQADITSSEDWDRVRDTVMAEDGKVDFLINNAGAGVSITKLEEMSDEDIIHSVNVNLIGALLGCKRFAGIMKEAGCGTIINVSSVCERQAWPGFSVYSAAKAGLGQFSKCLYTELRKYGVRVTNLIPSWGPTGFVEAAGLPTRSEEVNKKSIQLTELGNMVVTICELPEHLEIQDITLWPMIQEVVPL